jgi:hypothetical protein
MRKSWIALTFAVATAASLPASEPRILRGAVPVEGLESVHLDAGVGDIDVTATGGGSEVSFEVELKPRRGGFFSSLKKAQREVEEAELRMDVSRGVLRLEIETESDDRHFEERWIIELPDHLDINLDLGVGDLDIRGLAGGLVIDLGVGDIDVEAVSGDLDLDIGVGDATIQANASDYGSVEGSGGVGDAKLTVRGEKVSSSGFVGKSAEWTGDGDHSIRISVGVGDAQVTLH